MARSKADYYEIIEFRAGVYRIHSEENVFSDLIVGRKRALLVDTGYGLGDLRRVVDKLTALPLVVVNTHGHLDHVDGNGQFADCPIYLHPVDQPLYDKYFSPESRKLAVTISRQASVSWCSADRRDILPIDFNEESYVQAEKPQTLPMVDGMRFDLGGTVLRVCELPGHTYGSCGLLNESNGDFYVGDAVSEHVLVSLDGASIELYQQTLARLAALEFQCLLRSHSRDPVGKQALADYADCAGLAGRTEPIRQPSLFAPGEDDLVFVRPGHDLQHMDQLGFASLFTNERILSDYLRGVKKCNY